MHSTHFIYKGDGLIPEIVCLYFNNAHNTFLMIMLERMLGNVLFNDVHIYLRLYDV